MKDVFERISTMHLEWERPLTQLQQVIVDWRSLSPEERLRRQWARIPQSVAMSMAFAGEPVDIALLESEHAKHPVPYDSLKKEEICDASESS